jgi:hypothetical protein
MKRRFSSVLTALVLASFLAGGAIAPALHRVHHAQELHQVREAAPHCAHGVHTSGPVAEERGPQITTKRCPVLARHVFDAPPARARASAVLRQEATRSAVALSLHASSVEGRVVIRGPPARA